MKNYFLKLMHHPGLEIGIVMLILGALAGSSNKSFNVWWHGFLFGIIITFVFIWIPILITNFRKD